MRVAAKIYPEERSYHEREIGPLLRASPWVEFVGEVGGAAKDAFLGNAHALLFPIEWAEPFGLVMIEAMACGTPIIAFRRGSVPEVMVEGVTGYVVEDIPEAVEALARVPTLSRRACRRVFDDRYTSARMAGDYLTVYRRLIGDGPRSIAPTKGRSDLAGPIGPIAHHGGLLGPLADVPSRAGP